MNSEFQIRVCRDDNSDTESINFVEIYCCELLLELSK